MSKAVLISIKPKWCELIASGQKTVEVRKSKPNLEIPFKVYIYQTKQSWVYNIYSEIADWQRKVIGEFVCDEIYAIGYSPYNHGGFISDIDNLYEKSCLDLEKMFDYLSKGCGYGWHISDLKIYDKPKELSKFYHKCEKMPCEGCEHLKYQMVNSQERDWDCEYLNYQIPITKPPQSWCYVEELSV